MIALSETIERRLRSVGKGLRQQQREQDDQEDRQDDQTVDRDIASNLLARGQPRQFAARRLKRGGFDRLHGSRLPWSPVFSAQAASDAEAAEMTADVVRASPCSSATMRPRENTNARWQIWAISSKSVDTTTTARPASSARAISL